MMTIFINNVAKEVQSPLALETLVNLDGVTQSATYAIAVNENFIPKTQYAHIQLNEGDRVEILSPMQGG